MWKILYQLSARPKERISTCVALSINSISVFIFWILGAVRALQAWLYIPDAVWTNKLDDDDDDDA